MVLTRCQCSDATTATALLATLTPAHNIQPLIECAWQTATALLATLTPAQLLWQAAAYIGESLNQLLAIIELRSLTESIDTATPGGRLVFHIFGALAEFERAVIRERTSAGLQAARQRGKKGGRPRRLGPKELAAARAMLADPEIRVEDVAAHLRVSPATLYRYLPGGRSGLQRKE